MTELKTLIDYHGTRLLQKKESKCQPYIVAERYDEETGTWACGHYFDDPREACRKFDEIALGHQQVDLENEAIEYVLKLYRTIFRWWREVRKKEIRIGDTVGFIAKKTQAKDAEMIMDLLKEQLELWGYDEEEMKG